MTNKLVVIINSLKLPKIKKILLYEMKFLVPNYCCLQNPWLGAMPPHPRSLCPLSSTEFVEPPLPSKKFLGTPLSTASLNSECSSWAWRLKVFRSLSTVTHSIVRTARQQRNTVLIRYSHSVLVTPLKARSVLDGTFRPVQTQHSARLLLIMPHIPPSISKLFAWPA